MSGDYSACENKICRLRFKCYRYMMERDPRYQVYSGFQLETIGTGRNTREVCEGFSDIRPGDVLRKFEVASN